MADLGDDNVTREQPIAKPSVPSNKRKYNNDPLIIHPADHPGLLVTTAVLTREAYFTWNQSVALTLQAKNKLGFIDGSFPNPPDPEDSQQWSIVDAMVRTWIMNIIEPRIQRRFQSSKTSREL